MAPLHRAASTDANACPTGLPLRFSSSAVNSSRAVSMGTNTDVSTPLEMADRLSSSVGAAIPAAHSTTSGVCAAKRE